MSFVSGNPVNTPVTINTSLSASGATQGAAAPITARVSYIVGGNGNSLRLPPGRPAGETWTLINNTAASPGIGGTNVISVFPSSGETIQPNAANAGTNCYAGNSQTYVSLGNGSWRVSNTGQLLSDAVTSMFSMSPTFYRVSAFYGGVSMFSALTMSGQSIQYTGATGTNIVTFPDNLAESLWFGEGTNRYITFKSTNNAEEIIFTKPISGYRKALNNQNTNYTTLQTDSGKTLQVTSASPVLISLTNSSLIGTYLNVTQLGAGQVSFTCSGGSVANASSFTKTRAQYSVCSLYVSSNTSGTSAFWILSGDTGA